MSLLARLRSRLQPGDRPAAVAAPTRRLCLACRHFRNDPGEIEAAVAGLSSLSSARASSRADDGLCTMHDRFVMAGAVCAAFVPDPRLP